MATRIVSADDKLPGIEKSVVMSNDVTRVLAELRRDHKNMSLCLNVLEREANRMYDNELPDFEIICDAMSYMTVYPDAVHHPKEDRLYAELKNVRPDLSKGFARIADDHRRIAEEGLELRVDLESITSGSFVRRKKVVADALRYVNNLRSHMQWEELDLFNRCETMASEGHDIYFDDIFIDRVDPVFGHQTEARFNRLMDGIQATLSAEHT